MRTVKTIIQPVQSVRWSSLTRTLKTIIQLLLLTGFIQIIQAQKADNVDAKFIEGKIHVSCLLQTASPVDLSLYWSDDGGLSFNPCLTVTGDLNNQSRGAKTIVWDCINDGIIMGNFIFKITCTPSTQQATPPVTEPRTPPRTNERTSRPTNTTPNRDTKSGASYPKSSSGKSHFLVMAGFAAGSIPSGTLTAGFLAGKWGGYAKIKSNFATQGNAQTDSPDAAFFIEDFNKKGRFTVSAGVNGQIANVLLIYAGIGYGSKWVQWKTTSEQLITIDEMSFSAIDPELGLIVKAGNFLIGAGVSALIGTQTSVEANISLGLIF